MLVPEQRGIFQSWRTFADLRVFLNLLPQKLISGKVAVAKIKLDLQVNDRSWCQAAKSLPR